MNTTIRNRRLLAFTLIELLTVIAIVSVIAVLAVPALSSLRGAGGITKTGSDIAGILEQARGYAMAQNTYVWVGFRKEGLDTLVVGVIASKTGIADPSVDVAAISKLSRFENVQLVSIPSSSTRPGGSGVVSLASASSSPMTFTFPSPGVTFNQQVIQWNSRGEARLSPTQLSKVVEIGLQASAGGTIRNSENFVAIQINGLSGSVSVYRP